MEISILILILFCLVIMLANIIQGITGFAGTLLAMPFLIMIIDLETAKHVLNFTGIVASIYILYKDWRYVDRMQVKIILLWMSLGLGLGIVGYNFLPKEILLTIFPFFILAVAIKGLFGHVTQKATTNNVTGVQKVSNMEKITLGAAGVIHGLFVSGGPLLVAYMSKKQQQKEAFRATLSVVWLILNSIIFIQSLFLGQIASNIVIYSVIAIIPLFIGIIIGGALLQKMSQRTFMLLSYILLIISGVSLFINNL
ncbi:MAG: TSUP family transporter [Culicoidibacterales bacterium]